jgi:hypothetical protein
MSGSERTVALLVVLGLMVVVAEGYVGNFRDWVRATVGASTSGGVPNTSNVPESTAPQASPTPSPQAKTSSGVGFNTF